jgi:hypothetical protein
LIARVSGGRVMATERWSTRTPVGRGNLAEQVERPTPPRPRRRSGRRVRPGPRLAATITVLWLLGFGGAVVSAVMIGAGYRVDALQAELTAMSRHEQLLAGDVALATSPEALAADAERLHVPFSPVRVAAPAVPRVMARPAPKPGWAGIVASVRGWLSQVRHAVVARG